MIIKVGDSDESVWFNEYILPYSTETLYMKRENNSLVASFPTGYYQSFLCYFH